EHDHDFSRRTVDGEHRLHGVEEPTDAGDGLSWQHEQHSQHRQDVAQGGDEPRAGDGYGYVVLRVLHLVRSAVRGLESEVGEEQERDESEEAAEAGAEVREVERLNTVLDGVDDRGEEEEGDEDDLEHTPERG